MGYNTHTAFLFGERMKSEEILVLFLPELEPALFPLIRTFKASGNWSVITEEIQDHSFESFVDDMTPENEDTLSEIKSLLTFKSLDKIEKIDLLLASDGFIADEAGEVAVLKSSVIAFYSEDVWPIENSFNDFENIVGKAVGLRSVKDGKTALNYEIVPLNSSTKSVKTVLSWLKDLDLTSNILEFNVAGGALERVRVPLEIEAWRMVREGVASPRLINLVCQSTLGMKEGIFTQIKANDPSDRGRCSRQLANASFADRRFTPFLDQFPDLSNEIWKDVETKLTLPKIERGDSTLNILVAGTPHLVDLWKSQIKSFANSSVKVHEWKLWDGSGVNQEDFDDVKKNGPFDLILEVLVSPTLDRQQFITTLNEMSKPNSQFWVHTLNMPASIPVQVIPEDIVAVGFGGIPSQTSPPIIELSLPKNSDASNLLQAVEIANNLGFQTVEVADEPGGVSARLLATMVNCTSFLSREGIIVNDSEADKITKSLFQMKESPYSLADIFGLDSIEGVLVGLHAFLGEERYRISPSITIRIESGMLGFITNRGYYV
jgi:3-hydroxyacyl-CoA dehydrogenase, C-terminal domain